MTPTDLLESKSEVIDFGAGYKLVTVSRESKLLQIYGPNNEMASAPSLWHPFYTTMARAIKAERDERAAEMSRLREVLHIIAGANGSEGPYGGWNPEDLLKALRDLARNTLNAKVQS
jgi:hypothetical protein